MGGIFRSVCSGCLYCIFGRTGSERTQHSASRSRDQRHNLRIAEDLSLLIELAYSNTRSSTLHTCVDSSPQCLVSHDFRQKHMWTRPFQNLSLVSRRGLTHLCHSADRLKRNVHEGADLAVKSTKSRRSFRNVGSVRHSRCRLGDSCSPDGFSERDMDRKVSYANHLAIYYQD